MAGVPQILPDFRPHVDVVPAPWAGSGRYSCGAMRHPIVKSPDGRLAVDIWVDGGRTMATVWRRADHPNLNRLPPNAPRAVKALYRADGQLAHLRGSGEYSSEIAKIAIDAWASYVEAIR